eukprot:Nitzschia sp. Nitz4//scaffold30_size153850//106939//107892//NITZ4_002787-RA/size153850-processed-gene-0.17-mRNA-1//1//CDS//3329547291//7276//frame0
MTPSSALPPVRAPTPEVQPPPSRPAVPKNIRNVLQDSIWDSLSELCRTVRDAPDSPFHLTSNSSSTIDLSLSFLKYKEYDWFDVDDNGAIVVPPKIPIFPEDFSPETPAWPLSWWGIVDPVVPDNAPSRSPRDGKQSHAKESHPPSADTRTPRSGRGDSHSRHSSRHSKERRSRSTSRRHYDQYPPDDYPRRNDYDRDDYYNHHPSGGPPPRYDDHGPPPVRGPPDHRYRPYDEENRYDDRPDRPEEWRFREDRRYDRRRDDRDWREDRGGRDRRQEEDWNRRERRRDEDWHRRDEDRRRDSRERERHGGNHADRRR